MAKRKMIDISELLIFAVEQNASDLHISAGEAPRVRINGDIRPIDMPPLSADDVESIYNSGVPNDLRLAASYDDDKSGNLKGYWIFEEGSGSTVEDLSGEGNDGTINSATFDSDVPS